MLRKDAVMEALKAAVANVPEEYTGGACSYENLNGERCLVGEVLFRLDRKTYDLVVEKYNGQVFRDLVDDYKIVETESTTLTHFLDTIQRMQDAHHPWHEIAREKGFAPEPVV